MEMNLAFSLDNFWPTNTENSPNIIDTFLGNSMVVIKEHEGDAPIPDPAPTKKTIYKKIKKRRKELKAEGKIEATLERKRLRTLRNQLRLGRINAVKAEPLLGLDNPTWGGGAQSTDSGDDVKLSCKTLSYGGTDVNHVKEAIALVFKPGTLTEAVTGKVNVGTASVTVKQLVVEREGNIFVNAELMPVNFDIVSEATVPGMTDPRVEKTFDVETDHAIDPQGHENIVSNETASYQVKFEKPEGVEYWEGLTKAYIFSRSQMIALKSHLMALRRNYGDKIKVEILFSGYQLRTGKMAEKMNMLELKHWKEYYSGLSHDFTVWESLKVEVRATPKEGIEDSDLEGLVDITGGILEEADSNKRALLPIAFYAAPCPPNYGLQGVLADFSSIRMVEEGLGSDLLVQEPDFFQNLYEEILAPVIAARKA